MVIGNITTRRPHSIDSTFGPEALLLFKGLEPLEHYA